MSEEDIEKLVESGKWSVGVWDLQFYLYNNETAEELKDHKGDVRIFRSDDFEVQCPDVEDLEEVWKPDIKPEEAKKPPLDELLRYLQDMTERGDYTAKKLLDLIKEEDD